ncbi:molybdenum cofactor guanylyltransferase [Saccharomonospora sp. NPDC006951]
MSTDSPERSGGEPGAFPAFSGIVLAGGAARRLGGIDKPMLEVGGMPMLYRAVAALDGALRVAVVGPRRDGLPGVDWVREDPPGTGPVAALAAGLPFAGTEIVVVLASDLPGIAPGTVSRLLGALSAHDDADGAVLVDATGRRQWLLGAWRRTALLESIPAEPEGAALRRTLGRLSIVDVLALPGEADDVDTRDDLDPA